MTNNNQNPGAEPSKLPPVPPVDELAEPVPSELEKPVLSEVEAKLAECERTRDEYLSGWQRAKADFVNYRREEAKRLEEIARYGSEELVRELITVIDNFDLAVQSMEKNGAVEKGVYLIKTQLEDLLRKRGLVRLDAPPGTPFDPRVHEAVGEMDSTAPPGTVADVIEPGYLLGEKTIRPVRVQLAKDKGSVE